jgi:hypothetical protein
MHVLHDRSWEMDGETPSLPNAAKGMTATRHPFRLLLPIAPPRPSRAAIPGRDRVLSVPVCLIGELREWTVRHHPYQVQPTEWTATRHLYQMQFGSRKVGMRACRANSETEADDFTIL